MSDGTGPAAAELRKLAHTLGVGTEELDMVAELPGDDLRALRKQVGEALFQADKHYFTRVATRSRTVPGAVAAKLTELALPPLIAARTAELLEPRRAVDLIGRISDRYLADVSMAMDAARAPEVIAAIPPERVARVARELAGREEWVVIGSFVTEVSTAALRASVAEFDGAQLLRIGFVLDDRSRLDDIGGMLSDEQIDQVLVAADEFDLWAELGELLAHLSAARYARLAERYALAPDAVQAGFRVAAERGTLDPQALARLAAG